MYRGVVQEADLLDRLPDATTSRRTICSCRCTHGRIWRIVHDTTRRRADSRRCRRRRPRSWCRRCRIRTAGGATRRSSCWSSAATSRSVPQLKTAGRRRRRTGGRKLHALWTLDGLDAIEPASCRRRSPTSRPTSARRRSGCRSAGWARRTAAIAAAVLKLADDPTLDRPAAAGGVARRAAAGGAPGAGGRRADDGTAAIRSSSTRRSAA